MKQIIYVSATSLKELELLVNAKISEGFQANEPLVTFVEGVDIIRAGVRHNNKIVFVQKMEK